MKNPFFDIKKNLTGVISLIFILIIGLIALFGYVIAPDNSENANQMHLSIHSKSPGFEVDMLVIPNQINNQSLFDSLKIDELVFSDTVPIDLSKFSQNKPTIISTTQLFGEAINRIHTGESVGALFRH